jgi:DNA-binding MarR family transcriptional regulator
MLALWERSPRRVGDLSDELLLEPATLSPLLKRLESAGFVVRAKDRDDERALAVSLTEAGAALRQKALAVPGQIVERLGMSIADLEHARDVLTALLSASRAAR